MSNIVSDSHRLPVKHLLLVQFLAVMSISLISSLISIEAAYSAALGGMIFVVPNALFIYKAFFSVRVGSARKIANSIYVGEAVKFGLTAVLFALVFALIKPLNELTLFVTFFVVLLINSLSPLFIGRPTSSK